MAEIHAPIVSTGPVASTGPVTIPEDSVVEVPIPARGIQSQRTDPSSPATTTFQEDLTTAGQRKVNLIWEYTQATVALMVVFANMVVSVVQGMSKDVSIGEHPVVLSSALFLIVGFYFSRTNHAAIGGVGKQPVAPAYQGR